jgi:sulfate transport system permease protein
MRLSRSTLFKPLPRPNNYNAMPSITSRIRHEPLPATHRAITEPVWVRWSLSLIALGFLILLLFLPLVSIFYESLQRGLQAYLATYSDEYARDAIWLTLTVAAIVVPINSLFGVAAAWLITKFEFKGKSLLITLIDLPFAVSPVIAGLIFVLIFGAQGYLGPWLDDRDIQIVFALPGIVLATLFITFPFVARELIPLMAAQGKDEEYAAITLGAGGWRTFFKVTLPNIKWALFYGIILCNARAMGEFGAVAVVSGNIKGQTSTMPLYIETLYFEYATVPAFALATLLTLLALFTLIIKNIIEWRMAR